MVKTSLKVKVKYIYLALILLPFIQQRTMQDFPTWLEKTYTYGALISATIVYFKFITHHQKATACIKRLLPIFLLWLSYIAITLLRYPQKIVYTTRNAYVLLAIAVFYDMEMNRNAEDILKVSAFLYASYALLNNILVIFFPEGIYSSVTSNFHTGHLLGDDNAIIYVTLPAMIILLVYSICKNGKITKFVWIQLLLCEVVLIRLWAGSAMICMAAFIILVFIGIYIRRIPAKISFFLLIILVISVFVGSNVPFISYLVENILHKDMTFTNRAFMWAHAFELFIEKPILGYGGYFTVGSYQYGAYVYPVHTPYLQMLLDGGLVLLGIFVWSVFRAYNNIDKNYDNACSQVILAGLLAIGVNYIFEWSQLFHLMAVLSISMNLDKIAIKRLNN